MFSKKKSTRNPEIKLRSTLEQIVKEDKQIPRNYGQVFGDIRYWNLVPEEIGKGPYELSLYLSILRDGSVSDRSVRVHVVGNFAQGKTSLVKRLVRENVKGIQSTDGIEVSRMTSRGRLLHPEKNEASTVKKFGLLERPFSIEHMFHEEEISIRYDIWDFGGQYVFYATHSLFHSNRAIYILVMDLSKDMRKIITDKKCPNEAGNRHMEYFIRFWMNSIHSFAGSLEGYEPPVILVGTHIDKVKGFRKRTRLKHAEKYFENVRRLFDGTQVINHLQKNDFSVNNRKPHDDTVDLLRDEIMRIGQSKARAVEIPTRWVGLEAELETETKKVITVEEIMDIVTLRDLPEMTLEEIKLFLQYQHAKGTLYYFDREPVANYIVLDPQHLIDAFKCIVTSDRFCLKVPEIRPLWTKLTTEGRLEMKLIEFLWNTENGFINNKEVLLGYLKQHHIISEAMRYDDNMEQSVGLGWYVVPSLLKDHCSQSEMVEYLSGKVHVQVRFLMVFEFSSVVSLLFYRLIAASLGRWPIANVQGENMMYENLTVFRLSIDHAGIVEIKDNVIELTTVNLCASGVIDGVVGDEFRRFAENVVSNEFAALKGSNVDKKTVYTSYYRCNNSCHGINGSQQIQEISHLFIKNKQSIPCPDCSPHEIDLCSARSEWFQENRVQPNIPKKDISDKEFSCIAQAIGLNWRFLGIELGLTDVQIDHIIEDNPHSVAMQIYKMLIKWRLEYPDEAKMDTFVSTLQQCSNVSIDWDKIRNMIDDMKVESGMSHTAS